jgi:23S rRNA (uracil1939-C5)-methyltransferase
MPWPERVPQIDLAVGDNGGATIILHHLGEHGEEFAQFLTSLPGLPNGCGLYLQSGRKESLQYLSGTNCLTYTVTDTPLHPPLTLAFSGGGFSQVNYPQNRQLIGLVEELAALTGQERLLDLYCGNGNFTIPLAAAAVDVVAIESYAPSLADGRENARTNNRTNIEFLCRDAARGVQEQIAAGQRFDVIVLDPPRSGAAEVVHLLAELSPERIIYVSCDPATLGRDLATLRRSGYEVITSVPVDMFPQTSHLESVTLLMREQNDTV